MKTITYDGHASPSDYIGERHWNELSVEEQDEFLLACVDGDRAWQAVMEKTKLKWFSAVRIATNIYSLGNPPSNIEEKERRIRVALKLLGYSALGWRFRRAIGRAAGEIVEGKEPDLFSK